MKTIRIILITAFTVLLRSQGCADPVTELTTFSAFKTVDINKMKTGEVLTARLPAMGFARGLSTQFCYLVPATLQKTVDLHEHWDATQHPELKVYLHSDLASKPTAADFSKIARAPDNAATRALFTETQKLNPGQINQAEVKFLKPETNPRDFWSDLLFRRASAFAAGGLPKEPAYTFNGETLLLSSEVERLLNEHPKIRTQFPSLIGSLSGIPPIRQLYWEMSNVEGTAAFSLGALCAKAPTDTWQAIDLHYYASSGYFVLLTFYQMWPVTLGTEQATLVWRCDLLSAPSLGDLHGVERLASANAMTKEIHQAIAIFLKDIKVK